MKHASLTALLLLLLMLPFPAVANDTALHEGRFGPEPVGGGLAGPESVIRMVSERLDVRFGQRETRVVARFTFRSSLAKVTAHQLVGFPDFGAAQRESDRRRLDPGLASDLSGPLAGLRTFVDGREKAAKLVYGRVDLVGQGPGWQPSKRGDGPLMAWHAVPVAFPPGRDVIVERRYRVSNGNNSLGERFFEYVTHTGGVWKGTIGRLEANVTLADGLTERDLIWPGARGPKELGPSFAHWPVEVSTRPARSGWNVLTPTRLQLVWHQFEPRTQADRTGFALYIRPK